MCLAEVSVMEQILRKFPNSQNPSGTEHAQTVCTRLFFFLSTHKSGNKATEVHAHTWSSTQGEGMVQAAKCYAMCSGTGSQTIRIPAGLKTTFKRLSFFFVSHVKSKHYDRPISFCGTIVGTS